MKKVFCLLIISTPLIVFSQKFGIKAGLNFSNISNASAINASSQTGFHAGVFLDIGKKIIGSRTEIIYSQQGYNYSTDSTKGSVKNNYIQFAQFIAINITKYVQVQVGFITGYLLNAKADSAQSTGYAAADNILKFYNRFDYGFGGGVEVHPYAGILVGARYNFSLNSLYNVSSFTNGSNSYSPNVDFKNNVIQVFVGYRF